MNTSTDSNDLMTVQEAADFLRKSERWIRYALTRNPHEEGSVPHYRLPGKRGGIRFVRSELIAWIFAGCPPMADMQSWRDGHQNNHPDSRNSNTDSI